MFHQNSTSNHNQLGSWSGRTIVVFHQNSTSNHNVDGAALLEELLCSIKILHQTTTSKQRHLITICCVPSKFYIKPQQKVVRFVFAIVVFHQNSTSNHNQTGAQFFQLFVVFHQNSTSNHNYRPSHVHSSVLCSIKILHQTTTFRGSRGAHSGCVPSKFYIKPQRTALCSFATLCCVPSKFYIKPQLRELQPFIFSMLHT